MSVLSLGLGASEGKERSRMLMSRLSKHLLYKGHHLLVGHGVPDAVSGQDHKVPGVAELESLDLWHSADDLQSHTSQ